MTTNLLTTTKEFLNFHGKSFDDVLWIGIPGVGTIDIIEFMKIADKEYDDEIELGRILINPLLVIVGDGWWLGRYNDEQYEGWTFNQFPIKPEFGKIECCDICEYDH